MAFIGIGKLISELTAGTPEETDNFIFANSGNAIKKITMKALKKALGIDSLNSALDLYHGYSNLIPNALSISDLRTGYVQASAGSTGLPEGVSTGTRHVYKISSKNIVIEIREHSPNVGRIWRRRYDGESWATPWTQVK